MLSAAGVLYTLLAHSRSELTGVLSTKTICRSSSTSISWFARSLRLQRQTVSALFNSQPFSTFREHSRTFAILLGPSRTLSNLLGPSRTFSNFLEPSRPFSDLLEHYRTCLCSLVFTVFTLIFWGSFILTTCFHVCISTFLSVVVFTCLFSLFAQTILTFGHYFCS